MSQGQPGRAVLFNRDNDKSTCNLSELIVVAESQPGVTEDPIGSNSGEEVMKYFASVGIDFPAVWCAAFVVWCHQQAGIENIPRTGGVLDMWNKSEANRVTDPRAGDVMIMEFGSGSGYAGIVIGRGTSKTFTSIEGNTSDDGSREGYEVCERTRDISSCKGFLRFGC